jgi:hypothetical protein
VSYQISGTLLAVLPAKVHKLISGLLDENRAFGLVGHNFAFIRA